MCRSKTEHPKFGPDAKSQELEANNVSHLTPFQIFVLISILKIAVVLVITLTAVAYTVLLERKVIGRMQNRWGPSRTGPFGLLQPLADGIKLFLKEDLMPTAVERPLFLLAPVIALSCALISIAVVPFGSLTVVKGVDLFEVANLNIGLLVILGITSIGVYGIALSGWSSNNKYSLLGSLRATAQVISYELALGLSLVGVVLRAGSLNLRTIVDSQTAHGLLSWRLLWRPSVRWLLHLPDVGLRRDQSLSVRSSRSGVRARRGLPHGVLLDEVRHVLYG